MGYLVCAGGGSMTLRLSRSEMHCTVNECAAQLLPRITPHDCFVQPMHCVCAHKPTHRHICAALLSTVCRVADQF